MALFKSRKKKAPEPAAAASPAESIEAMRRRARHRLIGAVVLVLAGVIGFPLLFDTQPRPVAVDIPIEIPDRNKVKPLAPPPPVAEGKVAEPSAPVTAPAPAETVVQAPPAAAASAQPAPSPASTPASAAPAPAEKVAVPAPAPEKKAEPRPETRAEPKPPAVEAAKARALLEGKSVDLADGSGRYVVQVGAFAEKDKALQAQRKLDRAGLKNYTQVADTEDGKRIRVRAGPFASRSEADKAAEKIKGLDLPVRILTL